MNDIIITTTTSPQQQQQQPLLLPWLFLLLTPSCSKPMKIMIPTSSICVQLQPLSTLSPLSHLITFKVRTHTHAHHLPLFKCNSKSIHVYFYFILAILLWYLNNLLFPYLNGLVEQVCYLTMWIL